MTLNTPMAKEVEKQANGHVLASNTIHIRGIMLNAGFAEARRRLLNILKLTNGVVRVVVARGGQAFAYFQTKEQAAAAITFLNGLYFLGKTLGAAPASSEMKSVQTGTNANTSLEDKPSEANLGPSSFTCKLILHGLYDETKIRTASRSDLLRDVRSVKCKDLAFLDFASATECQIFYEANLGKIKVDNEDYQLSIAKA